MARKTKFFRVAVEGTTTDRRIVQRNWLLEAAKNYDREKYAARINMEHIRGLNPEWGFGAYGDVLALKTDTIEIDGQKRLALFAQIDPNDALIKLNAAGQKIFSSIELDPDFCGSGEAYLVGLAVTDTPASLGTEVLAFAAQHPDANPFRDKKQRPENLVTAAQEFSFTLDDDQTTASGPTGESLLTRVKAMFSARTQTDDARFTEVHQAVETIAGEVASSHQTLRQEFNQLRAELASTKSAHEQAVTELRAQLDATPAPATMRPPAIGGNGAAVTDC